MDEQTQRSKSFVWRNIFISKKSSLRLSAPTTTEKCLVLCLALPCFPRNQTKITKTQIQKYKKWKNKVCLLCINIVFSSISIWFRDVKWKWKEIFFIFIFLRKKSWEDNVIVSRCYCHCQSKFAFAIFLFSFFSKRVKRKKHQKSILSI